MRAVKPDKPYKDFPLTPHPNGTWVKKIKGKLYQFGGWSDPDAALAKYLHQVDDLQAGRTPEPLPTTGQLSIEDLCNEFLESKHLLVESGELSRRMHLDYVKNCKLVAAIVGRQKLVENLKPKDFDNLRAKLSQGTRKSLVGKVTLGNRIRMARVLFNFASDQDLIEKPVKYGQNFDEPDATALRVERNKSPKKAFTPEQIKATIAAATPPLKAMILLGINAALGQTDCATLPLAAIDLENGWLEYPRVKTAIERRCPLWPETVDAIRVVLAKRPTPRDPAHADLVFITRHGQQFVRINAKGTPIDAVSGGFGKILKALKLNGHHRAFYSLRRTFETVGGDTRDQIATDFIMGHAPASDDMAAIYRQGLSDQRLKAVTDHVHAWLFPPEKQAANP